MSIAGVGQYQLIMPNGETYTITIEPFNDEYRADAIDAMEYGNTPAEALGRVVQLLVYLLDDDADGDE